MRFPVVVNGEPVPARCSFATASDLKAVSSWIRVGQSSAEPAVQDAAEFAGLACKRWRFYKKTGRFTTSLEQIGNAIAKQPTAELALLVVARSAWQRREQTIGICLCRRTWSNSLCIDFLAANPSLLRRDSQPIAGIGRGLLYFATEIAETIKAKTIWGEATELSAGAYRHMFNKARIDDFFRLGRSDYRQFRLATQERWAVSSLLRGQK
jgi:hypothetical protein